MVTTTPIKEKKPSVKMKSIIENLEGVAQESNGIKEFLTENKSNSNKLLHQSAGVKKKSKTNRNIKPINLEKK